MDFEFDYSMVDPVEVNGTTTVGKGLALSVSKRLGLENTFYGCDYLSPCVDFRLIYIKNVSISKVEILNMKGVIKIKVRRQEGIFNIHTSIVKVKLVNFYRANKLYR